MSEEHGAEFEDEVAPRGVREESPGEDEVVSPPRRRRWLVWLLLWLPMLLLLLVIALVGLLLGTQTGLRTAIGAAEGLVPGMLKVERADGYVLGDLHLRGVELHLATMDLRLGSVDLVWSPSSLLSGQLEVQQLAARDIDLIQQPSPEEAATPFELPTIALPLGVHLREGLVERFQLSAPGAAEPTFVLDRALIAASLDGSELKLTKLEADLPKPKLVAKSHGEAKLQGDYALDVSVDWDLELPPAAQLHGRGQIGGDLKRLDIRHRISGAVQADLDAKVRDALSSPSWDAVIGLRELDLPAFKKDLPAVTATGRLESHGNLDQASLDARLDALAPDLPDFGHLALALDALWKDKLLKLNRLELTEQVSDTLFRAGGEVDLNPGAGRFDLAGSWQRLRWPLSGQLVAQSPEGEFKASGTFEDYRYQLSTQASGPSFPAAKVALAGQGTGEGTQLETLNIATLNGTIDGKGEVAWSPELRWDLALVGKGLDPGQFIEGLDDAMGLELETKGGLDGFDYSLSTKTLGPGLPPATLSLIGKGDRGQTRIETLRLEALDGRIEGSGKATFAPQITWDAKLQLAGINPGSYAPEWPGRIDGKLRTQGRLEPDGPNLTAVIDSLEGKLRGYPIAASGDVAMDGGQLSINGLTATSGPSKVRVDGTVDEVLDLIFSAESPDLASLLPNAKGSISAKGRAQGPVKTPRLVVDLTAKNAMVSGQGIASLAGNADLDLAGDGRFQVQLDGKDLAAGGMRWSAVDLRGNGTFPNHRLDASMTGDQLSLTLDASGSLGKAGDYDGRVTTLDLKSSDFGLWRLERPAALRLASPKISAGPLCLREKGGSGGCLEFDQTDQGKWAANVDLDRLAFDLLKKLMPQDVAVEGMARIKGRFQASGPTLSGSGVAEIPKGQVKVSLANGAREVLDFSDTRLNLDSSSQGLNARLAVPVKELADLKADLSLPGWRLDAPSRPNQSLKGRLLADVSGLSRLSHLVPEVSRLSGSINADLGLGGTLSDPSLKGQARIKDVNFQVPFYGLKVKDFNLASEAVSSERSVLKGQATIGGGKLDMNGDVRVGGGGFASNLRIQGKKLKVADTKEYYALISPNFDLEVTSKGAGVRGELVVPEARIRPRSVPPGTVTPSSDVVLESKEQKSPYPVTLDVRLKLGKEVTIDAFGVRGRLAGDVRVYQQPGKDILGDGQLQITDGQYRMSTGLGISADLATPLTISQGRLIYSKSPIENPGLLLQAERNSGSSSAGIRVMGTLRKPQLAFFSDGDPNMTQADIMKYLMTGIPPSGNDQGSASLTAGTYITPKIYMEYESGLGDAGNKVKLRYDLSRHVEIETESGDSQSADIYYKFEN